MNNEERKYFSSLIGFTFDSDDLKYIEQMVNKRNKIIEEVREYIGSERYLYNPNFLNSENIEKILEKEKV